MPGNWFELLLKYTTWPVIVAVIVIGVCIILRSPFGALVRGIRKVKIPGTDFEAIPIAEGLEALDSDSPDGGEGGDKPQQPRIVFKAADELIRRLQLKMARANLSSPQDKVAWLKQEYVYRQIEEQVRKTWLLFLTRNFDGDRVLLWLNGLPDGASFEQISDFYQINCAEEGKPKFPVEELRPMIDLLKKGKILNEDGDAISISDIGRDYLAFKLESGRLQY